ncbi:MAG: PAS domain S-box protein, partial [Phycisphaerae bacterium]
MRTQSEMQSADTPGDRTPDRQEIDPPDARLHVLYFVLAGFVLLTVVWSSYLNHKLIRINTGTIAHDQHREMRCKEYAQLAKQAQLVNAPGNDVFESRDVPRERARFEKQLGAFRRLLQNLIANVHTDLVGDHQTLVLASFVRIDHAIDDMVQEARALFGLAAQGDYRTAGVRMAALDRGYVSVSEAVGQLYDIEREIENRHLQKQEDRIASLRSVGNTISALVLLVLFGIMAYGLSICVRVKRLRARARAHVRALREHESRLQAIVSTAADGIITIDERGLIESFNESAENVFGISAREVLGRNISMLMPAPSRKEHDGYLKRYLETREAHIIGAPREVTALRGDGSTFPLEVNVAEAVVGSGSVFTAVVRDLTEIKESQRRIEDLAKFPDENPGPVMRIRDDGTILYANAGSRPILDLWEREVGQMIPDFLQPTLQRALSDGRLRSLEIECGDTIFGLRICPIGKKGYLNLYGGDITERAR